jgi:ADP-ribosyl-[dinitrogen reductase] hydrolase
MLLELAVGDAYGAGFEYADPQFIRAHNTGTAYVRHPRHGADPGRYTDDTQMTLAIAETLVAGEPWTPATLAAKFVEVFKRDPRGGYAGRFYLFLQQVRDGQQFLAEIRPDSDKSGSAMRAGPIGVLPDMAQVMEYARIQAASTHNTPDGINAAIAAALMPHYFLYRRGPKQELGRFLEQQVPGPWATPWREEEVGLKGWMCVQAAITAIVESSTMSQLLARCIAFTGDVDTVATIALAAGACSSEIVQDLPAPLVDGLENGPYGRDYLIALDQRLLALGCPVIS